MGGVYPKGAPAELVFTALGSLDVYSHRLREEGCLLFCGFQPSVLECLGSIPRLPLYDLVIRERQERGLIYSLALLGLAS